jgi:hypothetical protein
VEQFHQTTCQKEPFRPLKAHVHLVLVYHWYTMVKKLDCKKLSSSYSLGRKNQSKYKYLIFNFLYFLPKRTRGYPEIFRCGNTSSNTLEHSNSFNATLNANGSPSPITFLTPTNYTLGNCCQNQTAFLALFIYWCQ